MNVQINHPVTVSKYGSYKRYHLHMLNVKQFIEKHWERLVQTFKIERDVDITLRPLPRRRTQGSHRATMDKSKHIIQLDISKPLYTIIETLFHELTHAEQCEDGRLRFEFNNARGRWEWIWYDRNHGRNCGFGQTQRHLDKYNNQPWEIEANTRMYHEMAMFIRDVGPITRVLEYRKDGTIR